jgi:hypothetical protein
MNIRYLDQSSVGLEEGDYLRVNTEDVHAKVVLTTQHDVGKNLGFSGTDIYLVRAQVNKLIDQLAAWLRANGEYVVPEASLWIEEDK